MLQYSRHFLLLITQQTVKVGHRNKFLLEFVYRGFVFSSFLSYKCFNIAVQLNYNEQLRHKVETTSRLAFCRITNELRGKTDWSWKSFQICSWKSFQNLVNTRYRRAMVSTFNDLLIYPAIHFSSG